MLIIQRGLLFELKREGRRGRREKQFQADLFQKRQKEQAALQKDVDTV